MIGPPSSRPLGRISPSLLEELSCPLRVAFAQNRGGRKSLQPQAVPALLGDIAHDALEAVLRGEEIDRAWTAAEEHRCIDNIPSIDALPTARRMRLRIRKRLPALLRVLDGLGPDVKLLAEQEFETADAELLGRPDLIARGAKTLIIDYKTGLVRHDSVVRESHRRQLLFYGALVHECLGVTADRLLLFSLRQGIVEVPGDLSEMQQVAAEARQARNDFNERTPGPQPGRPSPTTCQFCPYAPNCDSFWVSVDESWEPTVGQAVRGRLQRKPEKSEWGQSTLTIEVHDGHLSGRVVRVNGIANDLVANAVVGDFVAAVDLRPLTDDFSSLGCSASPAGQRVTVS